MLRPPTPPRSVRRGFTLVEILVVVSIIAVLIGLLLGAVSRFRQEGPKLQMRADMTGLDTALSQFKAKFGRNVPCSGGGPNNTFRLASSYVDPSTGNFITGFSSSSPEIIFLKSVWPRIDLTDNGLRLQAVAFIPPAPPSTVSSNLASNGIPGTNPALLDPNQCLMFFLTGGTHNEYLGFATSQTQPFAAPATSPNSQRINPFFEVKDKSRLKDPAQWLSDRSSDITTLPSPPAGFSAATPIRWEGSGPTADNLSPKQPPGTMPLNEPWFLDPWKTPYLYMAAGGVGTGGDYPFRDAGAPPLGATPNVQVFIGPWGGKVSGFNNNTAGPAPFRDSASKFTQHNQWQIVSGGPNGSDFGPTPFGFGPGGQVIFGKSQNYTTKDAAGDDYVNFRTKTLGATDD